jgi:ADP-ribose pyrophosphatase
VDEELARGRFLSLKKRNGWEFVERTNATDIVAVIAVTPQDELILVEQFRARVIELPAGLVGDVDGDDSIEEAGRRELLEETGFSAGRVRRVFQGPISAGLSTEILTIVLAESLAEEGPGGGVDGEDIQVHRVKLSEVKPWLDGHTAMVDPKVYAALVLLGR